MKRLPTVAALVLSAGLASAQTTYVSQQPDHGTSGTLWFSDVATYDPVFLSTQFLGEDLTVAPGDRIMPTKLTWWGADYQASFTGTDQFTVQIFEDDGTGYPGLLLWTDNGVLQPTVTVTGWKPTGVFTPWDEKRYELPLAGAPVLESGQYFVVIYNETTFTSDGVWGWADASSTHPASQPGFIFTSDAGASWNPPNPLGTGLAFELEADVLDAFSGNVSSISLSSGGAQILDLDAGPTFANHLYLIAGSTSGTAPGFDLAGMNVPLNPDAYFNFTLTNPNSVFLPGSFGSLDALGQASTFLSVGGGQDPALAGLTVAHAFVALDPLTLDPAMVSNAVTLDLLP